jgi:hypothetical protein
MDYALEKITPRVAERYLTHNTKNRKATNDVTRLYAAIMKRGEWKYNGDPIRFDVDGFMLDGQHRLMAIAQSGVTQDYLVIRGLPRETFTTIDIGRKRTAGDILSIAGMKNTNAIAAGVRMYLHSQTGNPFSVSPERRVSNEAVLQFAEDNPIVVRSTKSFSKLFAKKFVGPATVCFIYIAASRAVSEESALEFFELLEKPEGLGLQSPIFLLRDKLMQDHGSKKRLNKAERVALIIKAFRLWNEGIELKTLRIATTGPNAEKNIFRFM